MNHSDSHLVHVKAFDPKAIVVFTLCVKNRNKILDDSLVHDVLKDIWEQSAERNHWFVGRYVIMPDHLHFFACPGTNAMQMSKWMQLFKSMSSRRINRLLNLQGPIWQRDYFDRFMRSSREFQDKWIYVKDNPLRLGLVENADDWPYQGCIHPLKF